ncbi:MAG: terminase small subunit [Tildeniella torsiva UHER 1998/13D]|jgi:phage terminase small subunit|nr:terminase small subunit [Tildeniella torsiva UHER 1998/13D]
MAIDPAHGLTDKQAAFCREYLLDGNATAAYQRAGYTASGEAARRNASRLLTKADTQRYLAQLRTETSQRASITLERTLEEIGAIAFSNISDVMSWGPGGVDVKPSDTLPAEVLRAVESITDQVGDSGRRRTVKMHSKMQALGMLANYFGLNDDFNQARATLKRYGLALVEDPENSTGWSLRPYEA